MAVQNTVQSVIKFMKSYFLKFKKSDALIDLLSLVIVMI